MRGLQIKYILAQYKAMGASPAALYHAEIQLEDMTSEQVASEAASLGWDASDTEVLAEFMEINGKVF
jgi:regulator of RNase E activity RraB